MTGRGRFPVPIGYMVWLVRGVYVSEYKGIAAKLTWRACLSAIILYLCIAVFPFVP